MLENKFKDFLIIMESMIETEGFRKGRKKGEYYKESQGKIIKMEFIMIKVIGRKEIREIRSFISIEYPEIEKIIAQLKQEKYKKGDVIFRFDIDLFRGKSSYRAFYYFTDSNMNSIAENISELLRNYVFPDFKKYEKDEYLLEIFANGSARRRLQYHEPDISYYLRLIALCIKNNLIKEAFAVMDTVPIYHGFVEELDRIKLPLQEMCKNRIQKDSSYAITSNRRILFHPSRDQLTELVLGLDSVNFYYFILIDSITNDYLQVGGGNGEYTLEIRTYGKEHYNHYKAGLKDFDISEKQIIFRNGFLKLQNNQVLSIYQVNDIISVYLEKKRLHRGYEWMEMEF